MDFEVLKVFVNENRHYFQVAVHKALWLATVITLADG